MKLAVFDFDSTLMDGETIDILAKYLNIEEEISKITHLAMNGELDFFESLTKRVAKLKGLSYSVVKEIVSNLPAMNGAKETIKTLKDNGYVVVCFSGGFKVATTPFCKKLGIDADFSNILHHKDGKLSGLVGGEMMFNDSKGEMLKRLQAVLKITPKNTIAIGDGANDKSMFAYANKKVAFCAKDALKKEANIIIENKNLTEVLNYI